MERADLLLVGRVARAHGNRGQVIVNPDTDFAEERFRIGTVLMIGPAGRVQEREIREVRFQQGRPIVALNGVDTINDAELLAGMEIWLPASRMTPLPEGTFYRHDLIGCDVRGMDDSLIGRVSAVEGPLERSILIVEGGVGELMIPMVGHICVQIDVPARRIVVNPPAGLLELNARTRGEQADGE